MNIPMSEMTASPGNTWGEIQSHLEGVIDNEDVVRLNPQFSHAFGKVGCGREHLWILRCGVSDFVQIKESSRGSMLFIIVDAEIYIYMDPGI
jgi:hypothetical protein